MGKKFPLWITEVRVTEVLFLSAIVSLLTGTYFSGVWLMFVIRVSGILNSSTCDTMPWWKRNSISFLAPSGMFYNGWCFTIGWCFTTLHKSHLPKSTSRQMRLININISNNTSVSFDQSICCSISNCCIDHTTTVA